jgi:hypothetical protein
MRRVIHPLTHGSFHPMEGEMKRIFLPCSLLLSVLIPALNACGPQTDNPVASETAESPDEPSILSRGLITNIGSAIGSPIVSSSTCNQSNESSPPAACTYLSDTPDQTYLWTAPFTGNFNFTLSNANFDTVLHIYNTANGTLLGCNDDAPGTSRSALTFPVNAGQQLRIVVDGFGWYCGNFALDISGTPTGPVKRAMTWSLLGSAVANSRAYALVGSDSVTNAYQGDTPISQALPVLCINKSGLANPGTGVIGSPVQTPGGAWRRTWSGGTLALTSPVTGTSLTALSVANSLCANQFGTGYRMAEFHDGDPNLWSGWDFWGEARGANLTPFQNTRFWVFINGQNANPW